MITENESEISKRVQEIIKKEKSIFEQEKALIMKDLKIKKERIGELEMKLLESE